MKARIFEIKRFAVHDGDGIRTTVFFKGCPLNCVWCHNPEGIAFKPQTAYYAHKCIGCGECAGACPTQAYQIADSIHRFDAARCIGCGKCAEVCPNDALIFYGREVTVEELLPLLLEDKDFYANSGGGVTLSGGECLMQADFCAELLKRLKENGIHTAVDTCGFVPQESLDRVMPYTDIFLYDIKAINEAVHLACTGQSNRRILENIRYLNQNDCKIEVRIPYVPGYNDSEMAPAAEFLSGLRNVTKVRILPYHNYARSKYEALHMPDRLPKTLPSDEEIQAAESAVARR